MDPFFEEFLQATKWVTCFNIFGTVCTLDTCFVSHQIIFDNLKLWSESLFFSSAHLFSVLCFIHSLSLPYLHFHNLLYILVWCFQNCNQRCILQCYIYCRPFFSFTVWGCFEIKTLIFNRTLIFLIENKKIKLVHFYLKKSSSFFKYWFSFQLTKFTLNFITTTLSRK